MELMPKPGNRAGLRPVNSSSSFVQLPALELANRLGPVRSMRRSVLAPLDKSGWGDMFGDEAANAVIVQYTFREQP